MRLLGVGMGENTPLGGTTAETANVAAAGASEEPLPVVGPEREQRTTDAAAEDGPAIRAELDAVKAQRAQLVNLVQDRAAAAMRPHPSAASKAQGGPGGGNPGVPRNNDFPDDAFSFADTSDAGDSLLGGLGVGRLGGPGALPNQRLAHVVLRPDDYNDPDLSEAHGIIRSYETPHAVRRGDGIPVPFEPVGARFLADLKNGSAGFHKPAFVYQVAA